MFLNAIIAIFFLTDFTMAATKEFTTQKGAGPIKTATSLLTFSKKDEPMKKKEVEELFTPKNQWVDGSKGSGKGDVQAPNGKFSIVYKERTDQAADTAAFELYFKDSTDNKLVRLTQDIERSSVQISPDSKYVIIGGIKVVDISSEKVYYFGPTLGLNIYYGRVEKWSTDGKSFILYDQQCPFDCPPDAKLGYWKVHLQ